VKPIIEGGDATGILHDNFTLGSEAKSAFSPDEQGDAELLFQLTDVVADGGLGQRERLSRFCKIVQFRNCEQGLNFDAQHTITHKKY
jgi:hypothetical protein